MPEKWWEFLDSHIENLIPGILVLTLVICSFSSLHDQFIGPSTQHGVHDQATGLTAQNSVHDQATGLTTQNSVHELFEKYPYLAVGTLLSAAYLIGVLCFILGRALVHWFSRWILRRLAFRVCLGVSFTDFGPKRLDRLHRMMISKAMKVGTAEVRGELHKRRQRGRLLRTAFFPAAFLAYAMSAHWQDWARLGWASALIFLTWVLISCIYAYAEVCVFEEACFAHGTGALPDVDWNEVIEELDSKLGKASKEIADSCNASD